MEVYGLFMAYIKQIMLITPQIHISHTLFELKVPFCETQLLSR